MNLNIFKWQSNKARMTFFILVVFLTGISGLALDQSRLTTIANLKAKRIVRAEAGFFPGKILIVWLLITGSALRLR